MKLDTLRTLYIEELRDLYNAESQLLKALPKMAKAASSEELKNAFEKHLEQTKTHVERLEEVFEIMGKPAQVDTQPFPHGANAPGKQPLRNNPAGMRYLGVVTAATPIPNGIKISVDLQKNAGKMEAELTNDIAIRFTHEPDTLDRALEIFASVKNSFEAEHGPLGPTPDQTHGPPSPVHKPDHKSLPP